MITNVSTSADLVSAVQGAHDGDTILLAPGTYSATTISNAHFAGGITIASQNPDSAAVFNAGLFIKNDSGITLSDIETAVGGVGYGAEIWSSSGIVVNGLDAHGTLNNNPVGDGNGLLIRSSNGVLVENSAFHDLVMGVAQLDNNNLAIDNNDFRYIQTDGIRGGGTSNVEVVGNYFTDFFRQPGDHGDAIQFWTTNTTTVAHDIAIKNNVFVRGDGETAQGIFIRDETNKLPYQNVTITGNAIVGAEYNGITVIGGQAVKISDNLVLGYSDMNSWIRAEALTGSTISNNQTDSLYFPSGSAGITQAGNVLIPPFGVGDTSGLTAWAGDHTAALVPAPIVVTAVAAPVITLVGGVDSRAAGLLTSTLDPAAANVVTGGNTANNNLVGTDGDDYMDGGKGIDTLSGGAGNDTYLIDNARDLVVEGPDGGVDTVVTTYSSLTLFANVENAVLGGGSLQRLVGNGLNNVLISNTVRSVIDGGAGNDTIVAVNGDNTLTGGLGHDVFKFEQLSTKMATIADFTKGDDVVDLSDLLSSYQGSDPVADHWVKIQADSTGTTISVDLDGNAGAGGFTQVVKLVGVTAPLTAGTDWVYTAGVSGQATISGMDWMFSS